MENNVGRVWHDMSFSLLVLVSHYSLATFAKVETGH